MNYLIEKGKVNNQQEFGKSLGYNNKSSFSQLLNSDNLSDVFLTKIKAKYPEFEDWVIKNNLITMQNNHFENVGGDVINQTGDGNVNVYKGSAIKQDEEEEKYDDSNADVITILKKQIDIQNKQLKEKDEQIAQKDEQINKLINLLNKN